MRQTLGGEVEAVRNVEPGTRLAALPGGDLLLSQPEICANYNYYYDLYRLGPGGRLDRLTECGRFRFAAPLEDGRIAAIRVVNGEAEVVLLDSRGGLERPLYRAAPGEALTGIAAVRGTVVVTSLRNERWSLVEIAEGKSSVLVSDRAVKHSPRFGDSASEIYFVADYGNVSNVWSWRRGDRSLARWTDARNGVLEIGAPVEGELLVTTIKNSRAGTSGPTTSMRPRSGFRCGAASGSTSGTTGAWEAPWTGKLFTIWRRGHRLRATSACSGSSPESIRAASSFCRKALARGSS